MLTCTRWENWLTDENMKCRQIQMMLRANQTRSAHPTKKGPKLDAKLLEASEKERLNKISDLQKWHGDYCGDCKLEQEMLDEGRGHVAFGF